MTPHPIPPYRVQSFGEWVRDHRDSFFDILFAMEFSFLHADVSDSLRDDVVRVGKTLATLLAAADFASDDITASVDLRWLQIADAPPRRESTS